MLMRKKGPTLAEDMYVYSGDGISRGAIDFGDRWDDLTRFDNEQRTGSRQVNDDSDDKGGR
jgi:hypothetical protein